MSDFLIIICNSLLDFFTVGVPPLISAFVAILMYIMSKKQNEFIQKSEKIKIPHTYFLLKMNLKKAIG